MDVINLIDTKKMDVILQELISSFNGVKLIPSIWICGRSSTFGIRPSQKDIFLNWLNILKRGYITVTPIVFYGCDVNNLEKSNGEHDQTDFMVYNHYNILLSYIDKRGKIHLERYEPANSEKQGNLNNKLEKLFKDGFKTQNIDFQLISSKGLQHIHKDTKLCGHHILYWLIYRLKYGLEKSIELVNNPDSNPLFESFCINVQKLNVLNVI